MRRDGLGAVQPVLGDVRQRIADAAEVLHQPNEGGNVSMRPPAGGEGNVRRCCGALRVRREKFKSFCQKVFQNFF